MFEKTMTYKGLIKQTDFEKRLELDAILISAGFKRKSLLNCLDYEKKAAKAKILFSGGEISYQIVSEDVCDVIHVLGYDCGMPNYREKNTGGQKKYIEISDILYNNDIKALDECLINKGLFNLNGSIMHGFMNYIKPSEKDSSIDVFLTAHMEGDRKNNFLCFDVKGFDDKVYQTLNQIGSAPWNFFNREKYRAEKNDQLIREINEISTSRTQLYADAGMQSII